MFSVALLLSVVALGSPIGVNVHPGSACPDFPRGVGYVRLDRDLGWNDTEVAKFDACVSKIYAAGKQPIVVVGGWQRTNPALYAAEVAALTRRWPGMVWEICNEQNHTTFWQGTQEEYMALLRASSIAIRAADPKATVLLGGLAWRGAPLKSVHEWLRRAYRMGLRGLVDGIAVHPYTPVSVWPQALENIRRIQWANRDPVPLWLTEFGNWGMTWHEAQKIARDAVQRFPYVQTAVWYDLDGLGV